MKKWMLQPCRHCNGGALGALRPGEPSPGSVLHVPGEGRLPQCRDEGRLQVVRQADAGLPVRSLRGAQEKEAEVKAVHYFPVPQLSRNTVYCGEVIDWIGGTVISTALASEVTCPDCLKPESEADYWLGYYAAKGTLRTLLRKVPEEQMLGVVLAWLIDGINDDEVQDMRDDQPASDRDVQGRR